MKNDELKILEHLIKDMEAFPVRTNISHEEINRLLTAYDEVKQKRLLRKDTPAPFSTFRLRN